MKRITGGVLAKCDDNANHYTTIQLMIDKPELTDEQKAAEARKAQADLLAKCAEERRIAKEKMLARNAARLADLKAKKLLLNDSETLEQYDDRAAKK